MIMIQKTILTSHVKSEQNVKEKNRRFTMFNPNNKITVMKRLGFDVEFI